MNRARPAILMAGLILVATIVAGCGVIAPPVRGNARPISPNPRTGIRVLPDPTPVRDPLAPGRGVDVPMVQPG